MLTRVIRYIYLLTTKYSAVQYMHRNMVEMCLFNNFVLISRLVELAVVSTLQTTQVLNKK